MNLKHFNKKKIIITLTLFLLFFLVKSRYEYSRAYFMGKKVVATVVKKNPLPKFPGYIPRGYPGIIVKYKDSLYDIRVIGHKFRKLKEKGTIDVYYDSEKKQLMEPSVGKSHAYNILFLVIVIIVLIIYLVMLL